MENPRYLHEHRLWMTPFQLLGFQPSQEQADVAKLESSVGLLHAGMYLHA